jgi:hypothetical protein
MMSRFTVLMLGILCVILATVFALAEAKVVVYPSFLIETTVLMAISTWVAVKKLYVIQSPSTFTQAYLLSIVIKLVTWLGYLAVVFYLDREGAPANAVFFLINGLIMIGLEVFWLLTKRPKMS